MLNFLFRWKIFLQVHAPLTLSLAPLGTHRAKTLIDFTPIVCLLEIQLTFHRWKQKTKNKKPTAHVVVVVVVDATSSIQIWYRFDDKLFTCSRTIFFLVGFPLLKTFYWLNPYHTNFIRSSTIDNIHYFTTKYVREQRHPNSLSSLLLLLLFSPLCIHMGVCVCVCVWIPPYLN